MEGWRRWSNWSHISNSQVPTEGCRAGECGLHRCQSPGFCPLLPRCLLPCSKCWNAAKISLQIKTVCTSSWGELNLLVSWCVWQQQLDSLCCKQVCFLEHTHSQPMLQNSFQRGTGTGVRKVGKGNVSCGYHCLKSLLCGSLLQWGSTSFLKTMWWPGLCDGPP